MREARNSEEILQALRRAELDSKSILRANPVGKSVIKVITDDPQEARSKRRPVSQMPPLPAEFNDSEPSED